MERVISDEEKIRRAIEISKRRNYGRETTRVNVGEKKNYKLFKKMIAQILICLFIYGIFYFVNNTHYAFSEEIVKNTQQILNYDVNLEEWYQNTYIFLDQLFQNNIVEENEGKITVPENTMNVTTINTENTIQSNLKENSIQNNVNTMLNSNQETKEDTTKTDTKEENSQAKTKEKSQMEKDAESVKKLCKFQKPLTGKITSEFGDREVTLQGMTADHKGIDIAANQGTSIKAATAGTVSVASENSEYGKFIKIINEDVMTVYAHCSTLKVKKGDKIKIGQTIAKVGSTGVSTGPHLHFEIRYKNRFINPRLVINF